MAVNPRYIAKLITEDPNGPRDLAEYLNTNNMMPKCAKGRVSLVKYTEDDEYIPLTTDELRSIDFTEGYIEAHPEGVDRGGYVPTVHTANECAYYDENAGEWYKC